MVDLVLAVLAACLSQDPVPGTPTLGEVLARAQRYATRYQEQLGSVVAEESYDQGVTERGRPTRRRHLDSEFLMLRLEDPKAQWFGFRDVLRVDGKPVRNHEKRIEKLLLSLGATKASELRELAGESARYNIGSILRTINLPTLAVMFFDERHLFRFRFEKEAETTLGGETVWEIAFEEVRAPTLIKTSRERSIFARGSAWVEPSSGRITRTDLRLAHDALSSRISVEYRPDPKLGLWLPAEMKEQYSSGGRYPNVESIECKATYANFRRFGVESRSTTTPPR